MRIEVNVITGEVTEHDDYVTPVEPVVEPVVEPAPVVEPTVEPTPTDTPAEGA